MIELTPDEAEARGALYFTLMPCVETDLKTGKRAPMYFVFMGGRSTPEEPPRGRLVIAMVVEKLAEAYPVEFAEFVAEHEAVRAPLLDVEQNGRKFFMYALRGGKA